MDVFDRNLLLKDFPEEEDRKMFSAVLDAARGAFRAHERRFSQFLDHDRWVRFSHKLEHTPGLLVESFGGAEGCERRVLGFSPEDIEIAPSDFPVSAVRITRDLRFGGSIGHRDYLGAMLGLGISRKKIGDIFVLDEYTVAFVYRDIGEYVALNLERAGNVRVRAEIVDPNDIEVVRDEPVYRRAVVASLRTDAVIAAAFGLSRSKAQVLVDGGFAKVNWHSVLSPAMQLNEGDVISLKGYGRVVISEIKGKTKKDRISIVFGRYV